MSSHANDATAKDPQPSQKPAKSSHGLRDVAIALPYLSPVIYGAGLVFVLVGACMAFYQGRSSVSAAGFFLCLFACFAKCDVEDNDGCAEKDE